MKVEFKIDRYDCLIMTPPKKWRKKIREYMRTWGFDDHDGTAFIQTDWEIDQVVQNYNLTNDQLTDLRNGWSETVEVDPWTWLHHIGYDAHTLAE